MVVGLQVPLQSVPITTKVVSMNPALGEVYTIQHYVVKFVNDLRSVVFSGYSGFLHQHLSAIKLNSETKRESYSETFDPESL
jgi:hypothetical protein